MRTMIISLLFLACSGDDNGSGPLQELVVELTSDYYNRNIAFLPVSGDVEKVELEIEGQRLPFTVGAADLVAQHEAINRLILSLNSDAFVTTPIMPTHEVAEGGVFFVDPTNELRGEILVVSYR